MITAAETGSSHSACKQVISPSAEELTILQIIVKKLFAYKTAVYNYDANKILSERKISKKEHKKITLDCLKAGILPEELIGFTKDHTTLPGTYKTFTLKIFRHFKDAVQSFLKNSGKKLSKIKAKTALEKVDATNKSLKEMDLLKKFEAYFPKPEESVKHKLNIEFVNITMQVDAKQNAVLENKEATRIHDEFRHAKKGTEENPGFCEYLKTHHKLAKKYEAHLEGMIKDAGIDYAKFAPKIKAKTDKVSSPGWDKFFAEAAANHAKSE